MDFHTSSPAPMAVVVTGLPGTGKSTLADRLARALAAPSFSGDWLLGALTPLGVLDHADRPVVLGVYHQLLRTLLIRQLMLGQSAVVDGVVPGEVIRQWTADAGSHGGALATIECVCSDVALHRSRVEGRTRNIPGWHEVDWEHVELMRREIVPLDTHHLTLDAVRPVDENLAAALEYILAVAAAGRGTPSES